MGLIVVFMELMCCFNQVRLMKGRMSALRGIDGFFSKKNKQVEESFFDALMKSRKQII